MDFALSKFFWAIAQPVNVLLLALAGALILFRRRPGWARALLGGAALFMILLAASPLGRWSIGALEDRFPRPRIDGPVAGVVVLGGALSPEGSAAAGQPQLNDAAERLTELVRLARQFPQARLVFSGGSGSVLRPQAREADQVPALLESLGLDPARVLLERDSRNTWENALFAKQLVQPRAGEVWLLVTSAWHMPRAVGCFRAAGWPVLPYPVDFRSLPRDDWPTLDTLEQLTLFSIAAKEWVGLVGYHLMGRTDAWLPGRAD